MIYNDDMKSFGERLKKVRKEKGITQLKLAQLSGVAQSSISACELGKSQPSVEITKKLAKVLGVSVDYLLGRTDTPNLPSLEEIMSSFNKKLEEEQKDSILTKLKLKLIPVYDGANAGEIGAFPDANVIQFFATIPIDSTGRYGVIVHGDSMEPEIKDGDIVVVDPNQEVSNGKRAVVFVDGGVLVKRIYRQNGTVSFVSDNPKYPPIVIKSSDFPVYLLGKVVWILKREP